MAKLTINDSNGETFEIEAENSSTVVEAVVQHNVSGIDAECGSACVTCHVDTDEAWAVCVGPPAEMERDMLEFAFNVQENSRLSCQVGLKPEHDSLVIRVPERQN